MNDSLAVKYRPQTFSDVVHQDVIVKILKRQLETGEFSHFVALQVTAKRL